MVKYCAGLWHDFPADNPDMRQAFVSYVVSHNGKHFSSYKINDCFIVIISIESRYRFSIEKMFKIRLVPMVLADDATFEENLKGKCERVS